MPGHLGFPIAECFQKPDLLALQRDQPRQDHVDEEGGDEQEDRRNDRRHRPELVQFIGEKGVGDLVLAAIGAPSAILLQQVVDGCRGHRQVGAAQGRQNGIVEGAPHVENSFKRRARHVEHTETPGVGHHVSGTDRVDIFRRQHDARHGQHLLAAVHHGGESAAFPQPMRLGEALQHRRLVAPPRFRQAAAADIEAVDARLSAVRQGDGHAGGRLDHALDVEQHIFDDAKLQPADPLDRRDPVTQVQRGAIGLGEQIGKAIAFVKDVARLLQRTVGADGDDDRRHPAGHDQRHGEHLRPEPDQVAVELSVEHRHGATSSPTKATAGPHWSRIPRSVRRGRRRPDGRSAGWRHCG